MLLLALLVVGCGSAKAKGAAERAVTEFHEKLDKGHFSQIYAAAHPELKAAATEKDFVALLDAVHRKLGTIRSTNQAGFRVNSFNLQTNVLLTYKTAFSGGDAIENFNYRVDGPNVLLVGYNINSNALIMK